ncbi:unnamed protein product [Plutella xylostella]|uniref:(diamondback moth) hypothetical protein n=1 Tax=Plutella xylostella TaxID=51655 RepID=A0A8S4D1Z8_PLUXY|nr:unnamed protein product [Plutella xylostella]
MNEELLEMEQVFSEESDEGGGVDETAPPKPMRGPDIEFPLQRKDIDLLIEAFRKKKHRLHARHVAQILKEGDGGAAPAAQHPRRHHLHLQPDHHLRGPAREAG